ncbi:aspartyl protease [Hahella sp. CCB-MM4]|uniref:retropepsin-like aspartic protease family protein n=1 Tax=Hahella sp. (strain CCB-MM4) TaxID=1926491 RepID=UPI000BC5A316|nr:TIGR02281 family clan AA aspartic protease [Hahella sp. CCB-MM4]OZG72497.1 aspartyl protease [Hahella sp. CCB-MM4]
MSQDSPSPRQTGKWMMAAAWIIGMLLLTQLFGFWEDQQRNPNQTLRIVSGADGNEELVLQRNRFGHYLFTGKINNRDVEFLVDTGATVVAVPESMARSLGLPELGQTSMQTANGTTRATRTVIDQLQLGPFTLRDVNATILPRMNGDQEVLLGMSALRHLSFSQQGDQLILRAE